jgi:hypothetical protein
MITSQLPRHPSLQQSDAGISRLFSYICQRVRRAVERRGTVTVVLPGDPKGASMAIKAKARRSARGSKTRRKGGRRWSARVTQESDALDLDRGVFTRNDPKSIARSLKRSAERSVRRISGAYRSAISMLTFYINRGGKNLPAARKKVLEKAKDELRRQFGRA